MWLLVSSLVSIIDEIVRVFPKSAEHTCGDDKMRRLPREEARFKRNHFAATDNPQIKSPQSPTV